MCASEEEERKKKKKKKKRELWASLTHTLTLPYRHPGRHAHTHSPLHTHTHSRKFGITKYVYIAVEWYSSIGLGSILLRIAPLPFLFAIAASAWLYYIY